MFVICLVTYHKSPLQQLRQRILFRNHLYRFCRIRQEKAFYNCGWCLEDVYILDEVDLPIRMLSPYKHTPTYVDFLYKSRRSAPPHLDYQLLAKDRIPIAMVVKVESYLG